MVWRAKDIVHLFFFLSVFSSIIVCAAHDERSGKNNATNKNADVLKTVVVIGAGISGLTAARTLTNTGHYDVTLLEARKSRYGGRVWTDRVSFDRIKGVEADLGILLFDSRDPLNEMVKMFEAYEVTTRLIKSAYLIDGHNQKIYRGKSLDNITQTYQKIVTAAVKLAEENADEISLQMAVNRLYKQNSSLKGQLSSKMFSAITMSRMNLLPSNISCRQLITHKDLSFDTIIEEGFQEVADRLLSGISFNERPLDLEMNKVVRQIFVTSDAGSDQKKLLIRTTDRQQIQADAVIVAVPLGVLKSGELLFDPPLPSDKVKAIQNMGIGIVNNIIFEFSQVFWPKDIEIFHYVPTQITDIGVMTTWLNTGLLSGRKDPYLTTFIQGNLASHMENFTDDQLKEFALERLQSIFQVTGLSSVDIISVVRSQWSSDSFSKGFFSYPTIGSPTNQWDVLSKPICPHIFFAGEYTHPRRYGTVQGAYLSGLHAADQVLNSCQSKPSKMTKTKQKVFNKTNKNHGRKTREEL